MRIQIYLKQVALSSLKFSFGLYSFLECCMISFQVLQGYLEGKLLLWHCSMVSGEEGLKKLIGGALLDIFSVAPTFHGHSVGSNNSWRCSGGD